MGFEPRYTITSRAARGLMLIEAARQAVAALPLNEGVPAGLRQSARLVSTHYSTRIEGNRLTREQVERVLEREKGDRLLFHHSRQVTTSSTRERKSSLSPFSPAKGAFGNM